MLFGASVGDDGIAEELVEFRVFLDGHEDASGDDAALLQLLGVVAGQLQDFCGQVLEDGSQVDWGAGSNSLGISALSQESGDSSDWEVEAGLGGPRSLLDGSCFSFCFSFSTDGHLRFKLK